MSDLPPTAGQTVGPFFHMALPFDCDSVLVASDDERAVRLHGYVYDGVGVGVPDAMIEIRQADDSGVVPVLPGSRHRASATFTGWGRSSTDSSGHYTFSTLIPTSADGSAFYAAAVFARGLLNRLFTRIYVPRGDGAIPKDALLDSLDPEERSRLLAHWEPDGSLRFDVHLQGANESLFLTFPRHQD